MKKEAAKFNLNVPIKPSPNIFQHIKSDRLPVNPLDTADIYRIEHTDENNKKGQIGVTKWKINTRLKEHQSVTKNSKNNSAIARLVLNQSIKINFNNTKKLSNCNNRTYGYCHEAIEIRNNKATCNDASTFLSTRNGNRQWIRRAWAEEERGRIK